MCGLIGFPHFLQDVKDAGVIKICILRLPADELVLRCFGTAIEVTEWDRDPIGSLFYSPRTNFSYVIGDTILKSEAASPVLISITTVIDEIGAGQAGKPKFPRPPSSCIMIY